jgi:hypothetical protein
MVKIASRHVVKYREGGNRTYMWMHTSTKRKTLSFFALSRTPASKKRGAAFIYPSRA